MWNPDGIARLYFSVLRKEVIQNGVMETDVQLGIQKIAEAYLPDPQILTSAGRRNVDYNQPAYRCAYLHKYAPIYTAMVYEILSRAILQSPDVYRGLRTHLKLLKICSLGGGPGTDLIGALSALHQQFGYFHCSATVVDIKSDRESTLNSVILELRSGSYFSLGQSMNEFLFDLSFLTADLLAEKDEEVRNKIKYADLITMNKFLSAAACMDTASMIEEIFSLMKIGALVLSIENACGGFSELVSKTADKCELKTMFGPFKHVHYFNEAFNVTRFGYTSCYSTTVTVQILVKPQQTSATPT